MKNLSGDDILDIKKLIRTQIKIEREEIEDLIKKAILTERKRLAQIIYEASDEYVHNWEAGGSKFDWNKTMDKLSKEILNEDE